MSWLPHPSYQEGDESTFELVVAGRCLSDDPDAEVAIMMVEAGGTERSWQYYEQGAPKVTEEVLGQGLEAAKTWIRESVNLQRQLVAAVVAQHGPIGQIEFSTFSDYGDDVWARVEAVGTERVAKANAIADKTERNETTAEVTAAIVDELAGEFPDRAGEIKAAVKSLTKKLVRSRIVERGPAHRRPGHGRHPPAVGRGRPAAHRPRFGPLPARRDPGAQRHHPGHAPHGPDARHHQPR